MNGLFLVIISALIFVLAYRFYGAFIAAKVLTVNQYKVTPAFRFEDGHDYVPTNKYVVFGHHFAAIAGAGPLVGPVIAAQFGYLPGALWILIGGVLAGAVHDMVILFASMRYDGKSIAEIAKAQIGDKVGLATSFAVLFLNILAMAGMAVVIVNALHDSPWGTFTIGMTIPIAIFVGVYMQFLRPGHIKEGTVIGVALTLLAVILGPSVSASPTLAPLFTINAKGISIALIIYGFVAAALPVWLLLAPRDYLSTYMKIGTIGALALGIIIVGPTIQMPAMTQFVAGGGPVITGPVLPYIFITIACGAISGFHCMISTGTTPKMLMNERSILPVGYGAMLTESFVGMMALIAACSLIPNDYFAINSTAEHFQALGIQVVDLPQLNAMVGEDVAHRPGGIVASALISGAWGYIVLQGNLSTIWPIFGVSNQLLAIITLAISTVVICAMGKARFAWVTVIPWVFLTVVIFWADYLNMFNIYLPKQEWLLFGVSAIMAILVIIVSVASARKCLELAKTVPPSYDTSETVEAEELKHLEELVKSDPIAKRFKELTVDQH